MPTLQATCVTLPDPAGSAVERHAWLWWSIVAVNWWALSERQLQSVGLTAAGGGDGAGMPVLALALASVAGKFVGFSCEAGFYALWWRVWGAPLRFGPLFSRITLLSLLDVVSGTVGDLARERGGWLEAGMAPVVGFGAVTDPAVGGRSALLTAFGSAGLLTLLRIALTARFQARALGRSTAAPAVLVFATWLVTRLLTWWTIDLARGMSPSP